MNINPSSPQGSRPSADPAALDSARTREAESAGSAPAPRADGEARGGRPDSVDLSSEARALAEQRDTRAAGSSLSADRLREIGERLSSGYYDRPEVIDEVARRIANDTDALGGRS